jgi:hypothetical protein
MKIHIIFGRTSRQTTKVGVKSFIGWGFEGFTGSHYQADPDCFGDLLPGPYGQKCHFSNPLPSKPRVQDSVRFDELVPHFQRFEEFRSRSTFGRSLPAFPAILGFAPESRVSFQGRASDFQGIW